MPNFDTLSEPELIDLIKSKQDSAALVLLADRHAGIYMSVVGRYSECYPNTIKREDLADDRLFNIHRFILDYDSKRGTKLSTYIGDRTDWMCKGFLKKDRENPIASGTYGPSGAIGLTIGGDTYATPTGCEISLVDESASAKVVEVADRELQTEAIITAAREVVKDKRFVSILGYRHFNPQGKTSLSWRQIGEKVNLSHEGCRKIYNVNLAVIKRHLNKTCLI